MKRLSTACHLGVLLITGMMISHLCSAAASAAAPQNALVPVAEKPGYDVRRFGAVGDGKTLDTVALQKALEDCAQAGGGTVVIPQGVFVSGALFLKPGCNLELLEGAVLKGSTNISEYPKGVTRIETVLVKATSLSVPPAPLKFSQK